MERVAPSLAGWNALALERTSAERALALLSPPDVLEALDAAVSLRCPDRRDRVLEQRRPEALRMDHGRGHRPDGYQLPCRVRRGGAADGPARAARPPRLRRSGAPAEAQERHHVRRHLRSASVRDAEGRVTAVVGVSLDITERVEAAEALERSEKRLHEAERLAGVGSWDYDIVANTLVGSPRMPGRAGRRIGADTAHARGGRARRAREPPPHPRRDGRRDRSARGRGRAARGRPAVPQGIRGGRHRVGDPAAQRRPLPACERRAVPDAGPHERGAARDLVRRGHPSR